MDRSTSSRAKDLNPVPKRVDTSAMAGPGDAHDAEQRSNMWEELNRPRPAQHRETTPPPPSVSSPAPDAATQGESSTGDRIDPQQLLLAGGVLFAAITLFALSGLGGSGDAPVVDSQAVAATSPDALAAVTPDAVAGATVTTETPPTTAAPTTAPAAEPMAMGLPASLLDSEQSQVFRLYRTALGRAPDRSGFDFWADQIRAGTPLEQLANEFLVSEEFQAQFTDDMLWDNRAERLLTNAFGPAATPEELDAWLGRFAGLDGAALLVAISEADETLSLTGTLR